MPQRPPNPVTIDRVRSLEVCPEVFNAGATSTGPARVRIASAFADVLRTRDDVMAFGGDDAPEETYGDAVLAASTDAEVLEIVRASAVAQDQARKGRIAAIDHAAAQIYGFGLEGYRDRVARTGAMLAAELTFLPFASGVVRAIDASPRPAALRLDLRTIALAWNVWGEVDYRGVARALVAAHRTMPQSTGLSVLTALVDIVIRNHVSPRLSGEKAPAIHDVAEAVSSAMVSELGDALTGTSDASTPNRYAGAAIGPIRRAHPDWVPAHGPSGRDEQIRELERGAYDFILDAYLNPGSPASSRDPLVQFLAGIESAEGIET